MLDCFNRHINYLRVSVTDRCNLRCTYCMPAEGVDMLSHSDILSFDEIAEAVRFAVGRGIDKVRITGGEPLVRKGIVNLVGLLSSIEGLNDLSMTTNGILLPTFATQLKSAGLQRVNISLDTMSPERFSTLSRGGNLTDVLAGIEAAIEAGLTPVKLNCVIAQSHLEPDAQAVKAFADARGLDVRFIHQMNLETGVFKQVEGGEGGHCASCNRLRLTASGDFKPCLFSNQGYNIRKMGLAEAFESAIQNKPENGTNASRHKFYNIGG